VILPSSPRVAQSLLLQEPGKTLTWTGNGADNNWSTDKNWSDEIGNTVAPIGGERLVFSANPLRFLPFNNLSNLSFESINISGTGYQISGSSITVGTISSADGTTNTLTLGINPGAFFNVAGKAQLVFGGVISGAGSVGLMKQGTGELVINGFNTYAGATIISAGTLKMGVNGRIPDASAWRSTPARCLISMGSRTRSVPCPVAEMCIWPGGALDAGLNGDSTTFSGVITGVGDFDKSGVGS